MAQIISFPGNHALTSTSDKAKKSSAVTIPSVTREMRSATSREGQPLPSQSDVTHPPVTPIELANSPFLMPFKASHDASFMIETFSPAKISPQVKVLVSMDGQLASSRTKFSMAKVKQKQTLKVQTRFKEPPFRPTFIQQWRKNKGWNQTTLADAIGVSTATISQIETGKTGYSQGHLEAIANVLSCTPADLLMRNPSDPEAIWTLWDRAQPAQRKQMLRIMNGLLGDESEVA